MVKVIKKTILLLTILFFGIIEYALAQSPSDDIGAAGDEFTFVRIQYDNTGGGFGDGWGGWGFGGSWSIDYPDADFNFLRGVRRLTNIHINSNPTVLRLDDERIFEYPFLFQSERVNNRDYFVLNLAASYDVVRNRGYINKVQVWAKINNLLDERYQEVFGYSSPGFSMLAGLRVIFGVKPQPGEKAQVSPASMPAKSELPLGLSEHHWKGSRL